MGKLFLKGFKWGVTYFAVVYISFGCVISFLSKNCEADSYYKLLLDLPAIMVLQPLDMVVDFIPRNGLDSLVDHPIAILVADGLLFGVLFVVVTWLSRKFKKNKAGI